MRVWVAALCLSVVVIPSVVDAHPSQRWPEWASLEQHSVRSIAQTANGFLWLATEAGLMRFDGHHYRRFSRADFPALPSDRIRALLVAGDRLWIATNMGVAWMKDGEIHAVKGTNALSERIAQTSTGAVVVTQAHTTFWTNRPEDPGLQALGQPAPGGLVHPVTGADGQVWFGVPQIGMLRGWLPASHRVVELRGPGIATPGDSAPIPLLVRTDGTLLASDSRGLFTVRGRVATRIGGADLSAEAALANADGTMYVVRATGEVLLLSAAGHVLRRIATPRGARVTALFRDQQGDIWLGTDNQGLQPLTHRLAYAMPLPAELTGQSVAAIVPDTDGGIWTSVPCHGVVRMVDGRPQQRVEAQLGNTCVWTIAEQPAGTMWFGTWGSGLVRWDRRRQRVTGRWAKSDGLTNIVLAALPAQSARSDDMWIGGDAGLFRVDHGRARQIPVPHLTHVQNLGYDPAGHLWAGGRSGGFLWRHGALKRVTERFVRDVWFHRSGAALLSTYGYGLLRVVDDETTAVGGRVGVSAPFLGQFFGASGPELWVSSNDGLLRFDADRAATDSPAAVAMTRLTAIQGLPSTECNGSSNAAGFMNAKRTLYLPTVAGVGVVDLAASERHLPRPPTVHVEGVRSGSGRWRSVSGPVVVPADDAAIEVAFTAVAIGSASEPQFRYRLGDRRWREVGRVHRVLLTNLDPGRHNMQLQARVPGGPWSSSAELDVRVPSPWWRALWLRALVGLFFVGALLTQAHMLRRRATEVQRLVDVRTHELTQANAALKAHANVDALTGLANRRAFEAHLDAHWLDAIRTGAPISVVMIDIDWFKKTNDVYGHMGGDHCLQQLAKRLQGAALRPLDLVARFGGEEFVMVLPRTDATAARVVARRAWHAVRCAAVPVYDNVEASITVSVGVGTAVAHPGERPDRLIASADDALYAAKAAGRDRVEGDGVRSRAITRRRSSLAEARGSAIL